MADEGKFWRAITKSAGAGRPDSPSATPTDDAAPAAALQRVKDRWGPPAASVALFHDGLGPFAAQVRSLRASIAATGNGAPPRVIAVTSAGRYEGRTTVCANLAMALAETEAGRILVVDGDFGRPSLHLAMNVRAASGLRAVLREGLKLDGHVYETANPNVDILPSPAIGPDEDFEGLLQQRWPELLARLRKHYACVIVDAPPVLAGGAAATFAKHSDGVVLVARLEKTPRELVQRAADSLAGAGAKLIGCVLTRQKRQVPEFIGRFLGAMPTR